MRYDDVDSLDIFFLEDVDQGTRAKAKKQATFRDSSSPESSADESCSDLNSDTSSGSSSDASSSSSASRPHGRYRRKRRSRTKRGRLNAAILEETDDFYPFESESFPRRGFRTSSTSPPPAGRMKNPIAPGIYTRIRKRSATPMDFEDVLGGTESEAGLGESPLSVTASPSSLEHVPEPESIGRKDTLPSLQHAKADVSIIGSVESQSPTGLPIIQEFILDSQFRIIVEGRRASRRGIVLYYALCFLTCGLWFLIFKWFPWLRAKLTTTQTSLATSTHVLVTNSFKQRELIPVRRTYYGQLLSEVFGRQIVHELIVQDEDEEDPEDRSSSVSEHEDLVESLKLEGICIEPNEDIPDADVEADLLDKEILLSESDSGSDSEELIFTMNQESFPAPVDHVEVKDTESFTSSFFTLNLQTEDTFNPLPAEYLYFFEYRCIRFLYHPNTGRYFENSQWDSFQDVPFDKLREGLTESLANQRRVIYAENTMEIGTKGPWSLFIDEVMHPFNVFQIASIILWCFENYMLYATAIFLMSAFGSTMAVYETRKNLKYIKELSKNQGTVNILRGGEWQDNVDVAELVPGDIFEVTLRDPLVHGCKDDAFLEDDDDPELPCDAMLLEGGDCIVNESMLTGESLPISKIPMDPERWDNLAIDPSGPILQQLTRWYEKSILYSGTKLVRVRRELPSEEQDEVLLENCAFSNGTGSYEYAGEHKARLKAVALRTGFNTTKGNLIRTILFPRPTQFKFYRDSIKFVGLLSALSIAGFVWSVYTLIHLGQSLFHIITKACDMITIVVPPALPASMSVGSNFALIRLKRRRIYCIAPSRINVAGKVNILCFDKTGTLTEDSLDLVGVHYLEKSDAQTDAVDESSSPDDSSYVSPRTRHVLGPLYTRPKSAFFNDIFLSQMAEPGPDTLMFLAMGCCHTLRKVKNELTGDPLEMMMFDFTGLVLEEGVSAFVAAHSKTWMPTDAAHIDEAVSLTSGRPLSLLAHSSSSYTYSSSSSKVANGKCVLIRHPLQPSSYMRILKTFEFVPELRRQSVLVKYYGSGRPSVKGSNVEQNSCPSDNGSRIYGFVKGSPEEIKDLCNTVPSNYDSILDHYTFRGFRVLAVAYKDVNLDGPAKYLKRSQLESELQFLGFLVFENKLKSLTIPSLKVLKERAKMRTLMCTGDNILTAISVAKDCSMIPAEATVFIPFLSDDAVNAGKDDFSSNASDHGEVHIRWASSLDSRHVLSSVSLQPLYCPSSEERVDGFKSGGHQDIHANHISMADSSSVDSASYFPPGQPYTIACTGRILEYLIDCCDPAVLHRVLLTCSVFARLSPNQKQRLVECLQRLDYTVLFCGDGANDCGALKASDIGISLSEAEASVAAPFTCSKADISCVIDLLREGRSSLVTSFSIFKYMALYSLIQFNSVLILYTYGSNLGDAQFAYIDLIIIIPLAISMNRLEATATNLHCRSPSANLISKRVLTSLLSQLTICLFFQYLIYFALVTRPWYEPIPFGANSDNIVGQANTVLFCFSSFQYVIVAFVFTNNLPHQKSILTNLPFMTISLSVLTINTILTLDPSYLHLSFMELVDIPLWFRLFMFLMVISNFALSFLADRVCIFFVRFISRRIFSEEPYKGKMYKRLIAEFQPDICHV